MSNKTRLEPPVIVSACLYGCNCRYDGKSKPDSRVVDWINSGNRVILICPEQQGGQPTPRPDAELTGGDGKQLVDEILTMKAELTQEAIINERTRVRVREKAGTDVTKQFLEGARIAVLLARSCGSRLAILKTRSPSCGSEYIYDGTFSKQQVPGMGVTAALLRKSGLVVYSEDNFPFSPH